MLGCVFWCGIFVCSGVECGAWVCVLAGNFCVFWGRMWGLLVCSGMEGVDWWCVFWRRVGFTCVFWGGSWGLG